MSSIFFKEETREEIICHMLVKKGIQGREFVSNTIQLSETRSDKREEKIIFFILEIIFLIVCLLTHDS